jgi:SPP1 family predicted phage head-tail adaptor
VKAGRLDRRVQLQSRVVTRNASGEDVVTYSVVGDVWAEKFDLRGREFYAAQQAKADVTTRWRIRWRSDVSVLHRLVYEGRSYDINAAAEIGRREGLELVTTADVP